MSDLVNELFARFQVRRLSTPMKLVLQPVFDGKLQVFRNIVPVCYVSNPRHRHRHHELIGEGGQLCLQETNDVCVPQLADVEAVLVEHLVHAVGEAGLVVRTEVALIAARDLARVDEVKICCQNCETFCLEAGKGGVIFVRIDQVVGGLELRFPRHGGCIAIEQLLDESAGLRRTARYKRQCLHICLDRRGVLRIVVGDDRR